MYESYWGLSASPFTNRLSTKWFHESGIHEEALARLFYLIEQKRGFGLLSGGDGTGKSLTLKVLCEQVKRSQRHVAFTNLLGLDAHEMLWNLALSLGLAPSESESRWNLWRKITDQMQSLQMTQTQTIFVFDHLERADTTCLSLLERLFCTAEETSGLSTFITSVRTKELPRLSGILSELADLRVELHPFQLDETAEFIDDMLKQAGSDREIFTNDATLQIHAHTQGSPRLINRLCELSMIAGMAADKDHIDGALVNSVSSSLVTKFDRSKEIVEYHELV
jgi:general secretion pathway protein A